MKIMIKKKMRTTVIFFFCSVLFLFRFGFFGGFFLLLYNFFFFTKINIQLNSIIPRNKFLLPERNHSYKTRSLPA